MPDRRAEWSTPTGCEGFPHASHASDTTLVRIHMWISMERGKGAPCLHERHGCQGDPVGDIPNGPDGGNAGLAVLVHHHSAALLLELHARLRTRQNRRYSDVFNKLTQAKEEVWAGHIRDDAEPKTPLMLREPSTSHEAAPVRARGCACWACALLPSAHGPGPPAPPVEAHTGISMLLV